jgi:hypothetical protein
MPPQTGTPPRLIRSADGADNIGTALLLELPNRAAVDRFWNEEPFARNGGYQRDGGSHGGCLGIDAPDPLVMLQLKPLITLGHRSGHTFALETQGSVPQAWFADLDWLMHCLATAGEEPRRERRSGRRSRHRARRGKRAGARSVPSSARHLQFGPRFQQTISKRERRTACALS